MKPNSRQTTILLTLFAALLTAPLHAQNSRGSLRGTVQREAVSEDRGEFRLDDMLPGTYHITANAVGFAAAQAEIVVAVATVRDITVTMKPSSVSQTVKVQ